MQILNGILTGLMSIYVMYRKKKYGKARMIVWGLGFLTTAFYLDAIFGRIVASAGMESLLLQGLAILISKSILVSVLVVADVAGWGQWAEEPGLSGESRYLDVLTVGISFAFWLQGSGLAGGVCIPGWLPGQGKEQGFAGALLLTLLFALLETYYGSMAWYRKKRLTQLQLEYAAGQRQERAGYLRQVEDQYQHTRELRHDLKNHITLLHMLLQEGKYGEMADYLRVFGDEVDALALPAKSGNLTVDALLADKVARARRAGIAVELILCDLEGLPLRPDEICGLFGNLLDNALEANSRVCEGKFLAVECRSLEECYYIRVRNAVSAQDQGSLQSPKKDRKNQVGHGLGLRSAERIIHGAGGELAVEKSGKLFTAVVRVPKVSKNLLNLTKQENIPGNGLGSNR